MTLLSWRKDYEVGVPQIDSEHHRLFELVNEFHGVYLRGDGGKEIPKVLNQLVAYAQIHFQHEEILMGENDYPHLDKQREQHNDLITSIFKINEEFASDPSRASAETLQFVKHWLVDHILQEDMNIGDFLRRKASQGAKVQQNKTGEDASAAIPRDTVHNPGASDVG